MLLVNKVFKIYYPNQEMGIDQLVCKVTEETTSSVKVSYVDTNDQSLKERSLMKEEILRGINENKDSEPKESSCEDFLDKLWNEGHFDEMIEEMKRGEGYNSNHLIKAMLIASHADGFYLKDANDFDFDKALHNLYKIWQL